MQSAQQTQASKKEERIELPEDNEAKLSILFYASAMVMHDQFTPLVYELGIKNQQINGLTRIPRDMQKGNIDYVAMLRRLLGPITQFNITTTARSKRDYLLISMFVLGFMALIGYLYVSPEWRIGLTIWWAGYGGYLAIFVLIMMSFILLWLYARRRGRRNRPA